MRNARITSVVLALVSVFALSAIAAGAASAAELEQLPPSGTFTVSSGKSVFETKGKEKISCEKDTGSGEITGAKTDKSKVTFEKCTGPLSIKCTAGSKSGNIETEINSEVVWLNKAKKEAGEKLELAKELSIKCSLIEIKVKGATLCPVSPVNTKTTKFTLTCTQSGGKQSFTKYENEAGESKEAKTESNKGSGFEESGLQSEESLTFEKEAEIMT